MSKLNYFAVQNCLVQEKGNEGKTLCIFDLAVFEFANLHFVFTFFLAGFLSLTIFVLSVVLNRKHCVMIVMSTFLWGGPDQDQSDYGALMEADESVT